MASARRVLRDERLPICAVCGDRREREMPEVRHA